MITDVSTADDAKPVDKSTTKEGSTTTVKGLECIASLVSTVEETLEPISTQIQGIIPSWINGSLLRNGPGKFEFGNTR